MGYTTEFDGAFKFSQPINAEQVKTLADFAEERHGDNFKHDPQYPGFYCQWVPTEDGKELMWGGNDKFYYYLDWLQIIIDKFLTVWKIQLNGSVKWQGEDRGDFGVITVIDNKILVGGWWRNAKLR